MHPWPPRCRKCHFQALEFRTKLLVLLLHRYQLEFRTKRWQQRQLPQAVVLVLLPEFRKLPQQSRRFRSMLVAVPLLQPRRSLPLQINLQLKINLQLRFKPRLALLLLLLRPIQLLPHRWRCRRQLLQSRHLYQDQRNYRPSAPLLPPQQTRQGLLLPPRLPVLLLMLLLLMLLLLVLLVRRPCLSCRVRWHRCPHPNRQALVLLRCLLVLPPCLLPVRLRLPYPLVLLLHLTVLPEEPPPPPPPPPPSLYLACLLDCPHLHLRLHWAA